MPIPASPPPPPPPRRPRRPDPVQNLRMAVANYDRAASALAMARRTRNEAMTALKATGVSYARVAEVAGVSAATARNAILAM